MKTQNTKLTKQYKKNWSSFEVQIVDNTTEVKRYASGFATHIIFSRWIDYFLSCLKKVENDPKYEIREVGTMYETGSKKGKITPPGSIIVNKLGFMPNVEEYGHNTDLIALLFAGHGMLSQALYTFNKHKIPEVGDLNEVLKDELILTEEYKGFYKKTKGKELKINEYTKNRDEYIEDLECLRDFLSSKKL